MAISLGNKKLQELARKTPEQRKREHQAKIDAKLVEASKKKFEAHKRGMIEGQERLDHQREIARSAGLIPRSAPASKPRRRGMKR